MSTNYVEIKNEPEVDMVTMEEATIYVLVFLFLKSPKNYVHNKIIVLRWDGSIHVIYLLVCVNTP